MLASPSAASSTLSRPTTVVLTLTALVAAYNIYHYGSQYYEYSSASAAYTASRESEARLSRSNAVHRRRRRNAPRDADTTNEARDSNNIDDPPDRPFDDGAENSYERLIPGITLTDGETVVDDQEFPWMLTPEDTQPQAPQRSGQNIVQLLFRVSEDATRRNAYVHRGCGCNSCGILPIRGIRYRCANCADYDLCEGCEAQGVHIKTHIFYKIKVPGPAFGPRSIQPVLYAGDPDSVMRVLPKEITTKLSRETGFERPDLDAYWEQWTFMANSDWRDDPDDINLAMDRKAFERCLLPSGGYRHTAPNLIFDRMFAFYDTNKDDLIGFPEFLNAIAFRKKKDKWSRIFEGYDIDGDGYVDRKDFLRIFRSYYVLYRRMQQDMLESTEEQQMSSTDAHRLVSSRQPLSSAFGQDGRFPRAPDHRSGEGKTTQSNGDLHISDGKGIMNENSKDRGNREDIFRENIMLLSRVNQVHREHGHGDDSYWEMMRRPPRRVEELDPAVRSIQRNRERAERAAMVDSNMSRNADPALVTSMNVLEDEDNTSVHSDELPRNVPDNDQSWLPDYATVTDEDAEAVEGPGTRVADVKLYSQRAVIAHAVYRERVAAVLRDRWKRRQFYTDEEEGAMPPADWNDKDDVLADDEVVAESSKSQSRPSMHSRSSSKVRFAEDMDDFDTRSNPSTSSRSVPERWGGMEIPDAEKDAGKEILYQVTQQAFNELLDPLFAERENVAVEAAENKQERNKWRHEFTRPDFVKWASGKKIKPRREEKTHHDFNRHLALIQPWPTFHEVDIGEVRERPLFDLLQETGFFVESDSDEPPALEESPGPEAVPERQRDTPALATGDIYQDLDIPESSRHIAPPNSGRASPTEVLSLIPQHDGECDSIPNPSQSSLTVTASPPDFTWSTAPSSSASSYQDPTLPQFRPDSITSTSATDPTPVRRSSPPHPLDPLPDGRPSREMLFRYWVCEKAAKEAEERGGWGRLSCGEFERAVRKFVKEGKGNQMDYLGSWIDFCIP